VSDFLKWQIAARAVGEKVKEANRRLNARTPKWGDCQSALSMYGHNSQYPEAERAMYPDAMERLDMAIAALEGARRYLEEAERRADALTAPMDGEG